MNNDFKFEVSLGMFEIILGWLCFWAIVLYVLFSLATASGRVDFCFLEQRENSDQFDLIGHRSWRGNVVMYRGPTITAVRAAAFENKCNISFEKIK